MYGVSVDSVAVSLFSCNKHHSNGADAMGVVVLPDVGGPYVSYDDEGGGAGTFSISLSGGERVFVKDGCIKAGSLLQRGGGFLSRDV